MSGRLHYDTPEEWVEAGVGRPPFGRYIVRYVDGSRPVGHTFCVEFVQDGYPVSFGSGSSWVEAERRLLGLVNLAP